MAQIIDGKMLSQKIRLKLKQETDNLKQVGIFPKLAVIMVGDNKASKLYVKNQSKACEQIGIEYEEYILDSNIQMKELINLIELLNNKEEINGILLQSPISNHLDINLAFKTIDYKKDVDGFNPLNIGKLVLGQNTFTPCTPLGIMRMLEEYNIKVEGANSLIIGRSNIVGKPLFQCLLNKNSTVTICHSKTKDISDITNRADILFVALGKSRFITANMVKEGVVIIDIGINRSDDGKISGDVDFEQVSKKASYITPVPGGVGPMTITMLMHNVIKAEKEQAL